ncbi:hypothetical protein POM88_017216 [Heracleum sosnowskyi]|uniref:BED-type domain-containing protein n=1 Tax=Heracleum sosnowskyi TaxID=360622 RepID=A0AAD8IQE3_9APIA|nr:hypothetical protein POM88_017216 [Heracleum sosnowskyi]
MTYRKGGHSAWEHGTKVGEEGRKVRCNYCLKIVPNITRLKEHMARAGGNVTACPSVPDRVHHEFQQWWFQEGLSAEGQSSHQKTSRNAQTEDGGSHQNVTLGQQNIVDLDPDSSTDIGVSIKAKKDEIDQMVPNNKLYERKIKKKDDGSSTAVVVWGEKTSGLVSRNPTKDSAGESFVGGQSSHQQTRRDAQTNYGGSHNNVVLRHQLIDLDPDIDVPIKAKREDIDQMVAKMMYSRKMKRKLAECSSAAGNTTPHLEPALEQAEWEQIMKIQEIGQKFREKVQEVEAKNKDLENLRAALEAKEKKLEDFHAALEAKEKELAAKDDEMKRLRRGALAAQAEWYVQGRDEIIVKAKEVGLNHKLLLPDPAHDPTE